MWYAIRATARSDKWEAESFFNEADFRRRKTSKCQKKIAIDILLHGIFSRAQHTRVTNFNQKISLIYIKFKIFSIEVNTI